MNLSMSGICKSFGAGDILSGVDFQICGGEICALLGENGAGKSTLMNIIGGVYYADTGHIRIDGKTVFFSSPADSLKAGIAFIHQDLNLINDLTVAENLFLSGFPKKGLFLDEREMLRQATELFARFELDLDPQQLVGKLDASYKQMVAIARALLADASLIIMDEPTSSLTASEIERLFSIMRSLKAKGIAIIFISHKLGEVMEICDRYTVLRNGTPVSSGKVCDVTADELASLMVGHKIQAARTHHPAVYGEEILRVEHLSDPGHFSDVSLSLRRGEILGVTGLLGDGRSELFETIFGIHGKRCTGTVTLHGKEIRPASPYEALESGIAYLPKDRKENSIVADMSILDNASLSQLEQFCRFGMLQEEKQSESFSGEAEDLRIRYEDREQLITTLSGGNQQKVVLAKWLLSRPSVLILDNPTQGVDVLAKEEIHIIIEHLAASGIGVIVLSGEAQEILRICDSCLVMFHGRVMAQVSGKDMNETTLMRLATGVGKASDQ